MGELGVDLVWHHLPDGTITLINAALCALLGMAPQAMPGRRWQDHVHADDLPAAQARLAGLAPDQPMVWTENRVGDANGQWHWCQFASHGVFDAQGALSSVQAIGRDITPHHEADALRGHAAQLALENGHLRARCDRQNQLLAHVSHELRTPLTGMLGITHLLRRSLDPRVHARQLHHVDTLSHSGQHLLQLTNQLLDLASAEAGQLTLRPQVLDLRVLLQSVADGLEPLLQARALRLQIQVAGDIASPCLDPLRLRQVVTNLLANATRFSHERGLITVRATGQGDDQWLLEVEDEGVGISSADTERLFQPYVTLNRDQGGRRDGTGLGLALCRQLVRAQGGEIGVRSTLGVGSVFWVLLPRQAGGCRTT